MVAQPIERSDTLRWRKEWSAANDDRGGPRICGVLNASAAGGGAEAQALALKISQALTNPARACEITVAEGDGLEPALVEAAKDCDWLVIAGGDGSILTAAKVAIATGRPLMVIPMGTMNVFAHALAIPVGEAAIPVLANGVVKQLDVGLVNGELFLNCVMIGPFASLTRARETLRASHELTHWGAVLAETCKTMLQPHPYRYRLRSEGRRGWRQALALVVSNNRFSGEPFTFFARESLTEGELGFYALRHRNFVLTLWHLMLRYMGFESNDPALKLGVSDHLSVELDRPATEALLDGEVVTLTSPLKFEIRRRALQVIVPR